MNRLETIYNDIFIIDNWKVYNGFIEFIYLEKHYYIPLTSIKLIVEVQ